MNIDLNLDKYDCQTGVIFRLFESILLSSFFFAAVFWFFGEFVVSRYALTDVDPLEEEELEREKAVPKKSTHDSRIHSRVSSHLQLHTINRDPGSIDHQLDVSFSESRNSSFLGISNVPQAEQGFQLFVEDNNNSEDYEEETDDSDNQTFLDHTTFYKNLNNSSQYLRRDSYSQC